jgi:hypothetical protein
MTLLVRDAPAPFGHPVRNVIGETIGHLIRRTKPVYVSHLHREAPSGGFAVIDLDGKEIAWAATYMDAVADADRALQDRAAIAKAEGSA